MPFWTLRVRVAESLAGAQTDQQAVKLILDRMSMI
ncbi:hypothetical protein PSYAR_03834 [Pseudomonas syringae pv. aceris str. M302273]|nr:hypothetical protein PSYAR_03834 [Pseudomonas syringae pv. aceris str. M302273]